MQNKKDVSPEINIADLEPVLPKKRPVGCPRKVQLPVEPEASPEYRDSEWFCRPTPRDDEEQFKRLLDEQRALYSSVDFNPEILVYEDDLVRRSVTPPCGRWGFTVADLEQYSGVIRDPFTHCGQLTPGGIARARALLCRERILAGTVTPADRKPDISKLKDYLGPILFSLLSRD